MAPPEGRGRVELSLVGPDADVVFYKQQAARFPGAVLLLGSANGRIAVELAEQGLSTVGVDPSAVMVASAEELRARVPGSANRLRFLLSDLRALRLPERFSLVLAPQNALGLMPTLDDLGALLLTVERHLEPQGAFIFDLTGSPSERAWTPPRPEEPVHARPLAEPPRPVFAPHLRERRRSREARVSREGIRRLRFRQFSLAELDGALERAGFVAQERYGNFRGRPFEDGDAHQVVLAQRR